MPVVLIRHILCEVLRILILASLALVTVMSFATAVKPLTEGLLGPDTLLKFVVYMAPTMLRYALPFAAALATTLVYVRMSQDNEITAAQASGVGPWRLMAPVLALGTMMTVGMVFLSMYVAPALNRQAMRLAQADVVRMLLTQINDSRSFEIREAGVALYADKAEVGAAPEVAEGVALIPRLGFSLEGVVVGQLDEQHRLVSQTTARKATAAVYLTEAGEHTLVALRLIEPRFFEQDEVTGKRHLGRASSVDHIRLLVPNPMGDNVDFLSYAELRQYTKQPERYGRVMSAMEKLSEAQSQQIMRDKLLKSLRAALPVKLHGPLGGESYTLQCQSVSAEGNVVVLTQPKVAWSPLTGGRVDRVFEADRGELRVDVDPTSGEPVANVYLQTVRVRESSQPGVVNEKNDYVLDPMRWSEPLAMRANSRTAKQWLVDTAAYPEDSLVGKAAYNLQRQTSGLMRKVRVQFHQRLGIGVVCLMLTLLGAALALNMRGKQPLEVYFWCFLLAILSMVAVNTGAHTAEHSDKKFLQGILILWGGAGGIGVFVLFLLHRLRRVS